MGVHMLQTPLKNLAVLLIIMFASKPTLISTTKAPTFPDFKIAKPNCIDRCGQISIPFPFGTNTIEDCFKSRTFWLTCNKTFEPPKLFWQNTSIEIKDISLDGQMKILNYVAYDCHPRNGKIDRNKPKLNLTRHFTVNNTANKLTIVGCDTYAFVYGLRLKGEYTTGCMAICGNKTELEPGSCNGLGCCQVPIPEGVWTLNINLRAFRNYTDVLDFNNCGFAFFVEETAFNFSGDSFDRLKKVKLLPMVVDWVISNGTCTETKTNSIAYACKSLNSECYEPENGDGYRCRCTQGYQGNPYLDDGCQDINECQAPGPRKCSHVCVNTLGGFECPCPKGYHGDGKIGGKGCSPEPRGESFILKLVAGVSLGVVALLLPACLLYLGLKRRSSNKKKQKFFLQNGGPLLQEKLNTSERSPNMVKLFSSSELQKATNDFHNSMIIGQGGFGTVYRGLLSDNRIVAIKKSKKVDPNQIEQFINEVIVLSQINHRNVVRLLGCCLDTEVPLLVYEFISNGTLTSHIHNQAKARFFNWEMRLKIATETAGVLSYLHAAAATPIIHRDVKSDNILLDHTLTAKVSDFGASKLVPLDHTQLSTMVQGTFGYLDPEYMQTNQLTEKSDVYSFGVVLLELLTGRKAISFDKPEDEKSLANFFLSMLKKDCLFQILDENILEDWNRDQIIEVSRLAEGCLNVKGEDRPCMKEVAMELEGLRFGEKHSWARNEHHEEEMDYLLGDGLNSFANGEGNSSSVGYDSIRDHVLLPISGGR